jgi:hypothetical protein
VSANRFLCVSHNQPKQKEDKKKDNGRRTNGTLVRWGRVFWILWISLDCFNLPKSIEPNQRTQGKRKQKTPKPN